MIFKLSIELVPASCFYDNVRSILTASQWDALRKQVYSQAYYVCQICGGIGPKHPIEAHETWHYDDQKLTQILIGMIGLCPSCHECKHIGLAEIRGRWEPAIAHLMKINKITRKQADIYLKECFKLWEKRSKKKWKLDISHLTTYGIDTSKIRKLNK